MAKNLLVLDLDETLLHSCEGVFEREPDFYACSYGVYLRPFIDGFLRWVSEWYELAIWTSAGEDYAKEIVHYLFSNPNDLKFVWASNRCTRIYNCDTGEQLLIKDFCKIKRLGYDLNRVLVVDDSPEKHCRNYGNLIRVSPFEGALDDNELRDLCKYLKDLKNRTDYRKMDKRGWRSVIE